MKKFRFLAFLVLCALLLSVASLSIAADETPKLYFNVTFDELSVGLILQDTGGYIQKPDGSGNLYNNIVLPASKPTVSKITNRWGSNNCVTHNKLKGSTSTVSDIYLFWQCGMNMGASDTIETVGTDFVIQWDMYVDRDDGGMVQILTERSQTNGWNSATTFRITTKLEDGMGNLACSVLGAGNTYSRSVRFSYGKWSRFAAVFHPTAATVDLYLDGVLAFENISVPEDSQQVALGQFRNVGACPEDCTLSMDNIRMYSGNKPLTDAELGIISNGTSFAGVQFSNVSSETYGMRMVGTIDSLNYNAIGIDMALSYTENSMEKTKTATKQISTVYDSILATADGKMSAYTAEAFGGKYLWAVTLDGIPTTAGEITVDVDCWSMKDGVKTVQSRVRLVVANGSLVSSCSL